MIKGYNVERIYDLFGKLFQVAFDNDMNFSSIEGRLCRSFIIDSLENNDDSFLTSNINIDYQIVDTFKINNLHPNQMNNMVIEASWVGEAYARLFFKFRRSFEYIFLYFPINEMLAAFKLYHEMDWSHLYSLFQEKCDCSLLTKLTKSRRLSIHKLSVLTGINIHTLLRYAEKDRYLYEASFKNILLLSSVLLVKNNIFSPSLGIYLDTSIYIFDKKDKIYRSFLGFFYLCFFNSDVYKKKYKYDEHKNIFIDEQQNLIKVVYLEFEKSELHNSGDNPALLEKVKCVEKEIDNPEKCSLIVFDFNYNDDTQYKNSLFSNSRFKDIYCINQFYFVNLKTALSKNINSNYLNVAIIRRAKMEAERIRGKDVLK